MACLRIAMLPTRPPDAPDASPGPPEAFHTRTQYRQGRQTFRRLAPLRLHLPAPPGHWLGSSSRGLACAMPCCEKCLRPPTCALEPAGKQTHKQELFLPLSHDVILNDASFLCSNSTAVLVLLSPQLFPDVPGFTMPLTSTDIYFFFGALALLQ